MDPQYAGWRAAATAWFRLGPVRLEDAADPMAWTLVVAAVLVTVWRVARADSEQRHQRQQALTGATVIDGGGYRTVPDIRRQTGTHATLDAAAISLVRLA